MLEHELLREQFQALLDQQKRAVNACEGLAEHIADDPALQAELEQLRREKERHIRLTERLIEIVD